MQYISTLYYHTITLPSTSNEKKDDPNKRKSMCLKWLHTEASPKVLLNYRPGKSLPQELETTQVKVGTLLQQHSYINVIIIHLIH